MRFLKMANGLSLDAIRTRARDTSRRVWSPDWQKNRPRPVQIVYRTVLVILLTIFLIWLILFITKGRFLKAPFEGIASASTERTVTVGGDFQLYFAPFTVKFLAEDLKVTNADWFGNTDNNGPDFFTATLFDSRIATLPLIVGSVRFKTLELDDANIDLRWDAKRVRNNWTFGESKGEPLTLPVIDRARVSGTKIAYRDPLLQLVANIDVDTVKANKKGFEDAIRFSGGGTLRAKPFTLTGSLLSPDATIAGGRTQLAFDARSGGTRLILDGTLPGATQIDGGRFKVKATGPNLARLFDFLGIAVPESRRYRLASDLAYEQEEWRFTGMNGVIGDSDIAGIMTVSLPNDRLLITGDLKSKRVDILDLGPIIGYDPARLDAQGGAGAIRNVGGVPRLLPDAPLRYDSVQRFDAHIDFAMGTIRNEYVPVSDIKLTLDLDKGNLVLSPITMNLSGGRLAADIGINARNRPVQTSYDIRLSTTPMGRLLKSVGVAAAGTTGSLSGRIKLDGTGDSLRESLSTSRGRIAIIIPQGTMATSNVQLSELDIGVFVQKMFEDELKEPVKINCGLIGFTVRDGVAAADPVLIDTTKNVILGRGGFSFKTEVIDMALRADGKKFSLFSGQSPIGIDGYFAEPGIDPISGELLGRAGAGIGLAVVASPLAGILAFVDVGDAKATDCGPVLQGASAKAQRTEKGKPRDDVGNGTPSKTEDGSASEKDRKDQRDKFLRGR